MAVRWPLNCAQVGQWPKEDGTFNHYKSHSLASIPKFLLPSNASEVTGSLAVLAGGGDVEPCDDEEPESDDDDEHERKAGERHVAEEEAEERSHHLRNLFLAYQSALSLF